MPGGTTFDFQMMGKMMLFMFLQLLLLIPLLGIPAALAGYWRTSCRAIPGRPSPSRAGWCCSAELLPLVLGVAWAFQRFDISTETPA